MMKMAEKQNITEEIKIDSNLEILKKHFPNCFDKDGNFNLEKFKEEIKIQEINLSKESYSLEWLGKSYARVLTFEPARTLLKADENWNNKPENKSSGNILIKGDNLEVLKHLVNAYHEKIKMIYIDPPYNTGNDGFVYQDDRKFTVEELAELAGIDEERAKRILDFVNSKSNSHSAWLTFMYPRLYVARRLLREDGVIFVSIDDNEIAQLRILMDEIFGEENFVANFIWTGRSGAEDDSAIRVNHEYILMYCKSKNDLIVGLDIKQDDKFPYYDSNKKRYYKRQLLRKWGDHSRKEDRPNLYYPIKSPNGKYFYPKLPDGNDGCWRWGKEKMQKAIEQGLIEFALNKNGVLEAYEKIYEDDESRKRKKFKSLLNDASYTSEGTKEIKEYFNGIKVFDRPKPSKLMLKLLKISNSSISDIILDFFAGSGTTGDAVMQLNAEDGGNRKFILVQLDEPIDPKKNKTTYDFVKNELGEENPTIFHICKERLVRAAKKIKEEIINKKIEEKEKEIKELESKLDVNGDNKEKIEELKKEIEALKNQDLGFKIFETIPIWEDYLRDEKELTEQTTLFDESKLTEEDLKALLITWKTYDGIPLTEECKEVRLNNYTAYYCNGNLYLLHKDWKTENIKALLEKIDREKDFVVDKVIVFGYNFTSKHLREIEENIRNYSNKKQIEIETILRF